MSTDAAGDYRSQAWDFLAKSRQYLADGDLHQASEKGSGAAAHMMKAVAAVRGWEYEMHDQFRSAVRNARQWSRDERLRALGYSAKPYIKIITSGIFFWIPRKSEQIWTMWS